MPKEELEKDYYADRPTEPYSDDDSPNDWANIAHYAEENPEKAFKLIEELEKKLKAYKELLKWKGKIFMKDEETCYIDGLIQGAAENGIQWHKVADGDIPPDRHNVMSEKGEIVIMKDMRWYEYSPNYDDILQRSWEEPKYWCELPQFKG